ncbi:MAG: hypothetical protein WCY36_00795 [Candidatus Omnitrophota bacterium]
MDALKKKVYFSSGVLIAIAGIIFIEGSFAVTVKLFGVVKATFIRMLFTIPLSWFAIFLFANANVSIRVRKWITKKQESLSRRAQLAIEGGKFFIIVNTAIFLGPILASILMLMVGIQGRRVYFYAVLCALLSAWIWSCFYGGVCWGFTKVLAFWAK